MEAEKPNICCIENCGRSSYRAQVWCEKHYVRNRKYGSPHGGKFHQAGNRGDFWSKVDKEDPSGCWVWKNLDSWAYFWI